MRILWLRLKTENALNASSVVSDRTDPVLVSFDLNLTSELLTLTFDETVDASTFTIPAITLTSSQNTSIAQRYSLQGGISSINDSTIITLQLDFDDLNEVKSLRELATSLESTYLSIAPSLVRDMAGNNVVMIPEIIALQVSNYTLDMTPPELESFNVDLNVDIISLTFSETIRSESLNITLISLTNSNSTANQTLIYTLTGGNQTTADTRFLDITLNKEDSDQLRFFDGLLTSDDNTFIIISEGAITDMTLNEIATTTQQVTNFNEDNMQPSLVSFNLDLNEGILSLVFSETVRANSLNFTQISFQDDVSSIISYSLTNGSSLYGDNTTLTILLTEADLNELKRLEPLGVTENATFIALTPYAVQDMNDNFLREVGQSSARRVSLLTGDVTSPELLSYDIDLNSGEILLTFSETVRASTLTADQFSLQNSRNETSDSFTFYNLTSASSTNSSDGTVITLTIGLDDLNLIKQLTDLATNVQNTFLSFTNEAISDMFDNPIMPLNISEALAVQFYTPDITPPILNGFSLDLNTEELTLSFSETVNASTLNVSGIVLQSEQSSVLSNGSSYRLISVNTTTTSENGPVIVVDVSREDINAIKYLLDLATTSGNTYLSVDSTAIQDVIGLQVDSIPSTNALSVNVFQEDTLSPVLLAFSLNLTAGFLTLTFDETVNASSIDLAGISLHPANDTADGVSLMDSSILTENSPVIDIQIEPDTLNIIKLRMDLAINESNTYLRIRQGSVSDLAFIPQEITETFQPIDEFISDMLSPMILSFAIDLSNGTIILMFNEPVDVSTLSFDSITLQSEPNIRDGTSFQLTDGSTNSSNGLEVIIDIDTGDLNLIKQDEALLRNISTTYISFTDQLISDTSGNPVVVVPSSNAEPAQLFMVDGVMPRLLEFDLDMNTGLLTLIFSETVDVSTLMSNQITLQSLATVSNIFAHSHTLSRQVMLESQVDDTTVSIRINPYDLDEIKRRGIGLSEDSIWIAISNTTVQDMAGQFVYPLENGIFTRPVSNYTRDMTRIMLDYFTLDLNETELLTLYFSEAVNSIIPLNVSHVYLQSHRNATIPEVDIYRLTDSSIILPTTGTAMIDATLASGSGSGMGFQPIMIGNFMESDSRVVVIRLSRDDLNEIKRRELLATTRRNTVYIRFDEETVMDTFGNLNEEIMPIFGMRSEMFTPDTTSPILESFDLNLSTDQLILRFSETVNSGTFNASSFTLLSSNAINPEEMYTLSGGRVITSNDPLVIIQLDRIDANRLRNFTQLAVSNVTTFLSVESAGIIDMNGNQVVEVSAQRSQTYISDIVRPNLTEYRLDLNEGVLYLTFTETVNVSSFDPTSIVLSNEPDVNSTIFMLTGGSIQDYDSNIVSLALTTEDLNQVKFLFDLAMDISTTFISFTENFGSDLNSNPINAIDLSEAQIASVYNPDITPPQLNGFMFDANLGQLTLTFDETVNVDTFEPRAVTLLADPTQIPQDSSFMLSGGTVLTDNSTTVILQLTTSDFNDIKRLSDLAVEVDSIFITTSTGLVADMRGNLALPVTISDSLPADNFTSDETSPMLVEFQVDLNAGTLSLTFDETVNVSTLNFTAFSLQDSNITDNTTSIFTLTGGSTQSSDGPVILIEFSFEDLNELKRLPICTFDQMGSDCFLSFTVDGVMDAVNNVVLPPDSPVLPEMYIPDIISPTLTSFAQFNYVNETITLIFSETVSFASFDASEILFQNFFTLLPGDNTIRLSGGLISGQDSHIVTITLLEPDIDTIKTHPTICFRRNTCWLTLSNATVLDFSGNPVTLTIVDHAEYAEEFIIDEQAPILEHFDLSVEDGTLTLFFNEPVNVELFDPTAITLHGANPSQSLSLQGGRTSSPNGRIVLLNLSSEDVIRIKSSFRFSQG